MLSLPERKQYIKLMQLVSIKFFENVHITQKLQWPTDSLIGFNNDLRTAKLVSNSQLLKRKTSVCLPSLTYCRLIHTDAYKQKNVEHTFCESFCQLLMISACLEAISSACSGWVWASRSASTPRAFTWNTQQSEQQLDYTNNSSTTWTTAPLHEQVSLHEQRLYYMNKCHYMNNSSTTWTSVTTWTAALLHEQRHYMNSGSTTWTTAPLHEQQCHYINNSSTTWTTAPLHERQLHYMNDSSTTWTTAPLHEQQFHYMNDSSTTWTTAPLYE